MLLTSSSILFFDKGSELGPVLSFFFLKLFMSIQFLKVTFHLQVFPGAQSVKSLPAMPETQVQSLGQEEPLEKGMATHSSVLA